MNKETVEKILGFVFLFSIIPVLANSYTFTRNLTIGFTGEDVRQLQIFLNNYSEQTRVAQTSFGSPGNETSYFGTLTKNALIKFQNLNASEILTPVGLNYGTGYFGPSTMAFLDKQNSETVPGSLQTNTDPKVKEIEINQTPTVNFGSTQTNFQADPDQDFLMLSEYKIESGDKFFVGANIEIEDLDFYFNGDRLSKSCENEYVCELDSGNTKPGTYTLSTSDSGVKTEQILVFDKDQRPSVDVDTIKINTPNTLSGENLTSTITVHTSYGSVETNVTNNKFTFTISSPLTSLPADFDEGEFFVVNSDGLTSDIIEVDYEI